MLVVPFGRRETCVDRAHKRIRYALHFAKLVESDATRRFTVVDSLVASVCFQGPATPEKCERPVRANARRPERSSTLKVTLVSLSDSFSVVYALIIHNVIRFGRGILQSNLA